MAEKRAAKRRRRKSRSASLLDQSAVTSGSGGAGAEELATSVGDKVDPTQYDSQTGIMLVDDLAEAQRNQQMQQQQKGGRQHSRYKSSATLTVTSSRNHPPPSSSSSNNLEPAAASMQGLMEQALVAGGSTASTAVVQSTAAQDTIEMERASMSSDLWASLCLARLKPLRLLGSGAFGDVYEACDLRTGALVALKKLKRQTVVREELRSELSSLSLVPQCPGLLQMGLCISSEEGISLITEIVDGSSLSDLTAGGRCLTEPALQHFMAEMIASIEAMHEVGVLHRDLKPANIMVTSSDGHVKIIDFGLSDRLEPKEPHPRAQQALFEEAQARAKADQELDRFLELDDEDGRMMEEAAGSEQSNSQQVIALGRDFEGHPAGSSSSKRRNGTTNRSNRPRDTGAGGRGILGSSSGKVSSLQLPSMRSGRADVQPVSRGLVRQFRVLSPCLTLREAERILQRMAKAQARALQAQASRESSGASGWSVDSSPTAGRVTNGNGGGSSRLFGRLGAISVGSDVFLPRASMLVFDTTLERPEVVRQLEHEGVQWLSNEREKRELERKEEEQEEEEEKKQAALAAAAAAADDEKSEDGAPDAAADAALAARDGHINGPMAAPGATLHGNAMQPPPFGGADQPQSKRKTKKKKKKTKRRANQISLDEPSDIVRAAVAHRYAGVPGGAGPSGGSPGGPPPRSVPVVRQRELSMLLGGLEPRRHELVDVFEVIDKDMRAGPGLVRKTLDLESAIRHDALMFDAILVTDIESPNVALALARRIRHILQSEQPKAAAQLKAAGGALSSKSSGGKQTEGGPGAPSASSSSSSDGTAMKTK